MVQARTLEIQESLPAQRAFLKLLADGCSIHGAHAALHGHIVCDAADRQVLGTLIGQGVGALAAENYSRPAGGLPSGKRAHKPIIWTDQELSSGSRFTSTLTRGALALLLQQAGFTAFGARQVIAGAPLASAADRRVLASLLPALVRWASSLRFHKTVDQASPVI